MLEDFGPKLNKFTNLFHSFLQFSCMFIVHWIPLYVTIVSMLYDKSIFINIRLSAVTASIRCIHARSSCLISSLVIREDKRIYTEFLMFARIRFVLNNPKIVLNNLKIVAHCHCHWGLKGVHVQSEPTHKS